MIAKVLVGTDGSATAAVAVARAVDVAATTGAELTILSAGRDGERVAKEAAARHEAPGLTIHTLGVPGSAADALVDEARSGRYDLLVTGNKGLTGIRRLSPKDRTPHRVAHHLPCSFLVVKTT
jgi:nucleotide-binding universal stress UspA family protein